MICTTPRTGGNWLNAELSKAGIGAPEEHLRMLIESNLCTPSAVRMLWSSHQRNGVFGTKVHWNEREKVHRYGLVQATQMPIKIYGLTARQSSPTVLRNSYSVEPFALDLMDLLPPGRQSFVHLLRDDVYAQARSYAVAYEYGVWDRSSAGYEIGDRQVEAMRAQIELMNAEWDHWFVGHRIEPLVVTYEEQIADMADVVARIAQHVDG